jgi:hypothetical protein
MVEALLGMLAVKGDSYRLREGPQRPAARRILT